MPPEESESSHFFFKRISLKSLLINTNTILTKEQRIYDLNQKLDATGEIESAHQYIKIANSIFSEGKHKSRVKIIQLRKK